VAKNARDKEPVFEIHVGISGCRSKLSVLKGKSCSRRKG